MAKNNTNSKKGFTIIEVVLVLAIAGLIFLMVFIALPALQRGQRDTQRRDDMARFLSQLNQYQANNNGKVPDALAKWYTKDNGNKVSGFVGDYLLAGGDSFSDPSTGETYEVKSVSSCKSDCSNKSSGTTAMGEIYIYTNATCNGEDPAYTQGDRKIAITLKLEGAGIYCGHN